MWNLIICALSLTTMLVTGCADTSLYDLRTPAESQAGRYVDAEDLNRLPAPKFAITSFGIEFDTRVTYPSASCHGYQLPGGIYTIRHFRNELTWDLSQAEMQALVDQAYIALLSDLQTAGYEIVPHAAYHETPAYRTLIDLVGTESPVPLRFKFGDPENMIEGEALILAPIGRQWYAPALGEIGPRIGDTLASVGSEILYARRGFTGGQAILQAEVELARALDATLLKVYYVISPVRSYVETRFLEGALPVEGKTIVGGGQTRFAFRTPNAPTAHVPFRKQTPPRDGDAFVRLKKDIHLGTGRITIQHLRLYLDAAREMLMARLKAGR